jgi:hypothetical protein
MTFKEFYPYYLNEHSDAKNRLLHFIGTGIVISIVAFVIYSGNIKFLWFAPLAGYSFAWVGHFFIEKNKPATFQYPLFSLFSDFLMFFHMVTFQLPGKIELAKSSNKNV